MSHRAYYFPVGPQLLPVITLEVPLLHSAPLPVLATDRQPHVVRAHRLRGAAVAGLIRHLGRLLSVAAR